MSVATHETVQHRITYKNFSCTKFNLCYLTNRIPPTVRKSSRSQALNIYWELEIAIDDVVEFVNNNGDWTVVGWYKRGSIKDRSLIESSTSNNSSNSNEDATVGSGHLNFHVVELTPTNQQLLDKNTLLGAELNELKFDVLRLTQN